MSGREDFDLVGVERLPPQETLRPERPCRTLREFVRFLEEVEAIVGTPERPAKRLRGQRFLL